MLLIVLVSFPNSMSLGVLKFYVLRRSMTSVYCGISFVFYLDIFLLKLFLIGGSGFSFDGAGFDSSAGFGSSTGFISSFYTSGTGSATFIVGLGFSGFSTAVGGVTSCLQ